MFSLHTVRAHDYIQSIQEYCVVQKYRQNSSELQETLTIYLKTSLKQVESVLDDNVQQWASFADHELVIMF